jgi:hypothetical protein
MVCAIEDSGFEIRDQLAYIYGSGFPKSQNVGKMIDKKAGKKVETGKGFNAAGIGESNGGSKFRSDHPDYEPYSCQTDDAKKYQGYGTALKPAQEIIVLAQKALTPLGNCSNIINNLNEYIILCKQNVKPVANLSLHSQVVSNEVKISSVQENAEIQVEEEVKNKMETGKAEDLQEAMDISQYSKKEVNIVLNTMLLWKSILEEVCEEMKKSTTSMKYETIIDWKTFSLLLKQITPNSIIKVKTNQNGQSAAAYTAANYCSDQVKLLKNILTHSATANVIEMEVGKHLEETGIHPNLTPIVLARKPISESTIAKNVVKYGTGAIDIDNSRVPTGTDDIPSAGNRTATFGTQETISGGDGSGGYEAHNKGRWPANIIHDGSEEVLHLFPDSKGSGGSVPNVKITGYGDGIGTGKAEYIGGERTKVNSGNGSAARFFYCAKANKQDRNNGDAKNNHPTVKPTMLMQYLVRMITPIGGTILDPFNGSGSTGKAAMLLGKYNYIGIDLSSEYIEISKARIEDAIKNAGKDTIEDTTEDTEEETNFFIE